MTKEELLNKFKTTTDISLSKNAQTLFDSFEFQTSSEGYRPHISAYNAEKIGLSLEDLFRALKELRNHNLAYFAEETRENNPACLGYFYKIMQ